MNRVLIANTLPGEHVRALAEPLPDLGVEPGSVLAGDDSRDGFFIAARHVLLTGTPATGTRSVWLERRHVVQDCQVRLACRELRQSALGVERTLARDQATIVERIVASPDAAALVIEWRAPQDVEFDVRWTSEADSAAVFVFSAPVDISSVQNGTATDFNAHVGLAAGQSVRWLIVSHPALIADADPSRWLHVHAAAAQRRRAELLSVEAPADVARTWEWAKHCIAMQAHRPEPDAALVLAHIVIGDFATARKLLPPALTPYYHAALGDDATAVPPAPPDHAAADWQPTADPATLITSFAREVLGYAPDAARGRLTLRLRLPAGWDRASVHNIPIGDARIRLTCEQSVELLRLGIVQTAGAYPIRLIIEPLLARAPARAVVDGVPAQLNLRSRADRVVAPLQIMLDAERTLVFEF